jgi:hypothetical protein
MDESCTATSRPAKDLSPSPDEGIAFSQHRLTMKIRRRLRDLHGAFVDAE